MKSSYACGKIILSGEYAVLFGYPGIAVPAPLKVNVTLEEDQSKNDIEVSIVNGQLSIVWKEYIQTIITHCKEIRSISPGTLTIKNAIPLGKGMGASTALLVAIVRCFIGDDKERARTIEDALNPGHSGIDFEVIWNQAPVLFEKGKGHQLIDILMDDLLADALLIDTGEPDQQTPELVAWIKERKDELQEPLKTIGNCSKKIQQNVPLSDVFREHHRAQVQLGVVTDEAKSLITKIEQLGGAAKVIGAGSRSGGCGMILAINIDASQLDNTYPTITL